MYDAHHSWANWEPSLISTVSKQTGMDPIERLHFLAPGTGAREGGEKTQPFNGVDVFEFSAAFLAM